MWLGLLLPICSPCAAALATELSTPEEIIRTVVRANAEKDFPTMSRLMAHDEDRINYTIGGRKYVGWSELAKDLQEEFESVANLEIPIHELTVWTRGEIAWFAMEIDYIRYSGQGSNQRRNVLPLRETGVLARRNGHWILVAWHESFRDPGVDLLTAELSKTRK
jgi:SnoaL-like domain